jgi:hypothetical protein
MWWAGVGWPGEVWCDGTVAVEGHLLRSYIPGFHGVAAGSMGHTTHSKSEQRRETKASLLRNMPNYNSEHPFHSRI